ncbi:hypothetical protein VPNG_02904 [Cytospora leucostoma]|uniref:Ketoreductase (KR) domain-containing protein n=1 Tax=Cytospora leucostoma TaxID=1230097 RepID=A0A423XG67_9PEZI|nr:hypothetical protein VPNG_02904 [Cytospora leucostoma]
MGNIVSQFFFIPGPPLTEENCPDQTGRVFLVTGGYTGVGFELCKILYAHNATVWIAGRDVSKAQRALSSIKEASPKSKGHLEFLHLDLSDLSTVKTGADSFIAQQQRLDALVNNAGVRSYADPFLALLTVHIPHTHSLALLTQTRGPPSQVMYPPEGSTDAQGNELQMGTNCLGHYLLYRLLLPLLTKTASSSPTASVRVLWAASIAVHVDCPQPHGIIVDSDGRPRDQGVARNYGQTKVGNVFLARELAGSTPQTGVVHAAFNPGNLQTELQRHWTGVASWVTQTFLVHPPVFGAYTELWAALDPGLTPDKSGAYVYPWGRFGTLPAGIEASLRRESEGGTGAAAKFVEWCRKQTENFV